MKNFLFCAVHHFGQNIYRFFPVLAQFLSITIETEVDYYHQKVNAQAASRISERRGTQDLCKFGNFKKIIKILNGDYTVGHQKYKFWHLRQRIAKNQLQNIPQKNLFYLNLAICLQKDCRHKSSSEDFDIALCQLQSKFIIRIKGYLLSSKH